MKLLGKSFKKTVLLTNNLCQSIHKKNLGIHKKNLCLANHFLHCSKALRGLEKKGPLTQSSASWERIPGSERLLEQNHRTLKTLKKTVRDKMMLHVHGSAKLLLKCPYYGKCSHHNTMSIKIPMSFFAELKKIK